MVFCKTEDGRVIISEDRSVLETNSIKSQMELSPLGFLELKLNPKDWLGVDGNLYSYSEEAIKIFDEEWLKRFPYKIVRFYNEGDSYIKLFSRGKTKKDYIGTILISRKIKEDFSKNATKGIVKKTSKYYSRWNNYMNKIEEKLINENN